MTEDELTRMGFTIVDGRAVRTKGVMPSADETPASAPGGVTHPPKSTSKYRNVKCEWNGERFDSRHEMEDYIELRRLELMGLISDLRRQVKFPLYCPRISPREYNKGDVFVIGSPTVVPHPSLQVSEYVADFVFIEGNRRIVQDSKGHRTREYLLKRKWLALQEGIEIRET